MGADSESVRDLARIPVGNAWYLLLYAWDLAKWRDRWGAGKEAAPSLVGLLGRVLADSTADLLRHGLGRTFEFRSAEIAGLRGRIDISASLKRMTLERGKAVCRFPTHVVDNPPNQIIRSTIDRLCRDQRLHSEGAACQSRELKRDLRSIERAMDGVSIVRLRRESFSTVHLGRNQSSYRLPIAVCALLHRLEMPNEEGGRWARASLMRDEIEFSLLFERFVRNFFRFHLRDCRVRSEQLEWPDSGGSQLVPRMTTDTTIETRLPPLRRLIIDTKYYLSPLAGRFEGSEKFHAHNLYQLYAYLRTQEERSPAHREAEGVLLYPAVGRTLDEVMSIQGHRMRVRTLDLAAPWQEIEAGLLGLAQSWLA